MAEAAPTVRALGMVRGEIVRSLLIPYGPVAIMGARGLGRVRRRAVTAVPGRARRPHRPRQGRPPRRRRAADRRRGGGDRGPAGRRRRGLAGERPAAAGAAPPHVGRRPRRPCGPAAAGRARRRARGRQRARPALAADASRRSSAPSPRSRGSSAASGCCTASTTPWPRRRGRGRCGTRPRSPTVEQQFDAAPHHRGQGRRGRRLRDHGTRTDDRRGRGHPGVRGHATHRPPALPCHLGTRTARQGRGRARARHRAGAAPRHRADAADPQRQPRRRDDDGHRQGPPAPGRALVVRPGCARGAGRAHPDHRAAAAGALRAGGHEPRRVLPQPPGRVDQGPAPAHGRRGRRRDHAPGRAEPAERAAAPACARRSSSCSSASPRSATRS